MDTVQVQVMDDSGNWRTYAITNNISAQIQQSFKDLKWQFPNSRLRAVDNSGRVVDMYF